jgi:outer membrane protein OmpA-like peptidoglycan-associated protein
MNRKILSFYSLLAVCLLLAEGAVAQNYANKYGFEISGGIREYGGDRGTRYFIAQPPDYQAVGGSFSYYVNPSFDATIFGAVGDLGHRDFSKPVKLGFTARITEVMLGLRYKFANNYMIREDAKFRPYLQAGWGGMQSISKIVHDQPGYSQNRSWMAAHWAAGGGFRYGVTNNIDISFQSTYNYSFDDNYDGLPFSLSKLKLNALHDAYLYHALGVVFNFGVNEGAHKFDDKNDDVPEELVKKVNLIATKIHFETASATIKTESYSDLDSLVAILTQFPTIDAMIEGHTDNVGDDKSNLDLSQRRADAVKAYIIGKSIEGFRITATGYGETQPISSNDTVEGRQQNRRVEVKLYYRK